jgi:hypothetical protein
MGRMIGGGWFLKLRKILNSGAIDGFHVGVGWF